MNLCLRLALLPVLALSGVASVHAAEAPATSLVIDCARPALPSQREIGELTGQHNLGQVYATRTRLMAEARRACHREGTTQVLVSNAPQADQRRLASQHPAR